MVRVPLVVRGETLGGRKKFLFYQKLTLTSIKIIEKNMHTGMFKEGY